ncbi:MAG: anti-sigma factor domain-containing protein [Bacillota bacterium]
MTRQEKGILLEKNGEGIVFTDEGEFCRISPALAEIGEEVSFSRGVAKQWWTLALAAAVITVFIGLGMLRYICTGPVAYVALDINPSIEFGIDRMERVIEVNLLNEDARRLAAGLVFRGRPVTEAIALAVKRAEDMKYLSAEGSGVVLVTVVQVRRGFAVPETKRLAQAAVGQLEKKNVPAKVVAASVPSSLRKEARRVGLSPGRYALKVGADINEQVLTVRELKQEGLAQIERRKQVTVEKLLRDGHQDKVIVVPSRVQQQGRNQGKKGSGETGVRGIGLEKVKIARPGSTGETKVRKNKAEAGEQLKRAPSPIFKKSAQGVNRGEGAANAPPAGRMYHIREMLPRGREEPPGTGKKARSQPDQRSEAKDY